ncbi:helix-turn-helix domain-containing protein [Paenibacillus senegalensis]|uniref:helix-turn-helix domain-containing protein n=1 Tax=Paenibacillus senegalensis TaxID=1465766 RepID=UPI00028A1428|nr:helix-turn-helix domain-containing protein [Paenibacillus senegalensis]
MRKRWFPLNSTNRTTYFRKLIWLVCLSVYIPIVLVGTVYYNISVSRLTEEFKVQHMSSLELLMERIEDKLAAVEYDSLQFSSSQLVRDSFLRQDFKEDFIYHADMLNSMTIRKNTHGIIHEMVYYNASADLVLSNEYGYVQKDHYRYREDVDYVMALERQAGWVYLPSAEQQGIISYIRGLPVNSTSEREGAVIIQVREDDISQDLRVQSDLYGDIHYLIADSNRKILFHSTDKMSLGTDITHHPIIQQIAAASGNSGIIYGKDDAGRDTLHFYRKTLLDRLYVASISEEVIAGQLKWIQAMIVYTTVIFLIVGVIMSYISSKLAYNPVERLIRQGRALSRRKELSNQDGNEFDYLSECLNYMHEQSESLKRHLNELEPNIREQFLAKLVKGKIPHSREIIAESERLQIEQNGTYTVMVVMPEQMYKEKRFLPEEGPVIAFAIANVIKELLQKHSLSGYVISGDDKEAIILLRAEEATDIECWNRDMDQFAESVCEALNHYLSFTVSIGIGQVCDSLVQVPKSYREALLALQYRMFNSRTAINYYKNDQAKKQPMFFYPRELETEIIESLIRGDEEQAQTSIREFAEVVKTSESYNLINQSYHVLLSSIIRSIEQQGIGLLDIMENNWFDQLKSRKTMDEIVEWFIDVLFPLYSDILDENRSLGGRAAVQKVWQHVKQNVGENISLTECAELVGMSPSYLSRLFRKETGISFVDYVMECKVGEAKRLLRETEDSIQEIAKAVGYSERNLNRVFQRLLDMSPGQFRAKQRE